MRHFKFMDLKSMSLMGAQGPVAFVFGSLEEDEIRPTVLRSLEGGKPQRAVFLLSRRVHVLVWYIPGP